MTLQQGRGGSCRQTTLPARRMSHGRVVMKEWVGNRCLSRVDGASGAGKRVSGMRLSASEAECEDGASALSPQCSGAGSLGCVGPRLHGSRLKKNAGLQKDTRGHFSGCPLPPTSYHRTSRLSCEKTPEPTRVCS